MNTAMGSLRVRQMVRRSDLPKSESISDALADVIPIFLFFRFRPTSTGSPDGLSRNCIGKLCYKYRDIPTNADFHVWQQFVVACEPALSQYTVSLASSHYLPNVTYNESRFMIFQQQYATDFFRALAQISSGTMLPLTNASLLARVIVGSALEHMDMERLIQEVGAAVAAKIHGNNESVDEVARELHERLMLR